MEEDIEELKRLFYSDRLTQYGKRKLIEYYEQRIKQLEEENKRLKASHIVTHNKVSDEEKAKIFDVIDNSIDTYFEKSKPYWEQINSVKNIIYKI